jgi:A/G-specific adenine glycosylase
MAPPRSDAARPPRARSSVAPSERAAAHAVTPALAATLAAKLLAWFDEHRRPLPWRATSDAYRVWLSEVMLQQTRVETVIPFYERFVSRLPTVGALASASLDEVLGLWSGLGYYRRARQLQLAAREVLSRFGGELPRTARELRTLPGVGRYTAGAVSSIAWGEVEPLVDGNVERVFSRLFLVDEPAKSRRLTEVAWALASALVPATRPGDFNQALMELGATVCVKGKPACARCPLAERCAALAAGRAHELPRAASPKRQRPVSLFALAVTRGDRVLLARRPDEGLFGGLWEPPMLEARSLAEARRLAAALMPSVTFSSVGRFEHVLSHRRLDVRVLAGRQGARASAAPLPGYERARWVGRAELDASELGTSTLARRALDLAARALEPAPSRLSVGGAGARARREGARARRAAGR